MKKLITVLLCLIPLLTLYSLDAEIASIKIIDKGDQIYINFETKFGKYTNPDDFIAYLFISFDGGATYHQPTQGIEFNGLSARKESSFVWIPEKSEELIPYITGGKTVTGEKTIFKVFLFRKQALSFGISPALKSIAKHVPAENSGKIRFTTDVADLYKKLGKYKQDASYPLLEEKNKVVEVKNDYLQFIYDAYCKNSKALNSQYPFIMVSFDNGLGYHLVSTVDIESRTKYKVNEKTNVINWYIQKTTEMHQVLTNAPMIYRIGIAEADGLKSIATAAPYKPLEIISKILEKNQTVAQQTANEEIRPDDDPDPTYHSEEEYNAAQQAANNAESFHEETEETAEIEEAYELPINFMETGEVPGFRVSILGFDKFTIDDETGIYMRITATPIAAEPTVLRINSNSFRFDGTNRNGASFNMSSSTVEWDTYIPTMPLAPDFARFSVHDDDNYFNGYGSTIYGWVKFTIPRMYGNMEDLASIESVSIRLNDTGFTAEPRRPLNVGDLEAGEMPRKNGIVWADFNDLHVGVKKVERFPGGTETIRFTFQIDNTLDTDCIVELGSNPFRLYADLINSSTGRAANTGAGIVAHNLVWDDGLYVNTRRPLFPAGSGATRRRYTAHVDIEIPEGQTLDKINGLLVTLNRSATSFPGRWLNVTDVEE